jgi:hypothetical protein
MQQILSLRKLMSNKYLDKIASLHEAKHMGLAAYRIAKDSPMTVAFGVGGAMEGALGTRQKPRETSTHTALRGLKDTIIGGAKGAAAGKALELGYRHLKTKAQETM